MGCVACWNLSNTARSYRGLSTARVRLVPTWSRALPDASPGDCSPMDLHRTAVPVNTGGFGYRSQARTGGDGNACPAAPGLRQPSSSPAGAGPERPVPAAVSARAIVIWLILPVVICLSQ